jgi:four helix bundle protein
MKNEEVGKWEKDIYERVFQFGVRVERLVDVLTLKRPRVNSNSLKQVLRSSSSIGSNLEEGKAGQTRADFHCKIRIALKEARQTHYWLRRISHSRAVNPNRFTAILQESNEIVAILTTITKKTGSPE